MPRSTLVSKSLGTSDNSSDLLIASENHSLLLLLEDSKKKLMVCNEMQKVAKDIKKRNH